MTMTVTTDDKATAFQIARQLEITVPKVMQNKNNGLLNASVEDAAIEASTPNGMELLKNQFSALSPAVLLQLHTLYFVTFLT
mgnify:CR=1 FL=1